MRLRYILLFLVLAAGHESIAQTKHGVYGFAEGGVSVGENTNFIARAAVGYRFAYQWQVGLGAGLNAAFARHVPLFTTVRYDLTKKKSTFFLIADGGVTMPWLMDDQWPDGNSKANKQHWGKYLQGGLGYRLNTGDGAAFTFAATYMHSGFKLEYLYYGSSNDYKYVFNQLGFTVGFFF